MPAPTPLPRLRTLLPLHESLLLTLRLMERAKASGDQPAAITWHVQPPSTR